MKFEEKILTNNNSPYVIAEVGANHNGNLELACKMIEVAAKSGVDCVKFQSWTKSSINSKSVYQKNCFLNDDYRHRTDHTLESIVEAYSMSEKQLKVIAKCCSENGVDFASTPFCRDELDFLIDELKSPFIKVASMDCNNYYFLEMIGDKKAPVVLSTGLSKMWEIDKAVETLQFSGCDDICLLHCVANYPPVDANVNLNNMNTLRTMYPDMPVGYSDHSIGSAIPLAAVALGAKIIEKHFTLDKNMPGWDHKVSADPDEIEEIVVGAKRIVNSLGSTKRVLTDEDEIRKPAFRRSVVAARDIVKNKIITLDDLDCKRPGEGLDPCWLDVIVGRRALRNIQGDSLISREDF